MSDFTIVLTLHGVDAEIARLRAISEAAPRAMAASEARVAEAERRVRAAREASQAAAAARRKAEREMESVIEGRRRFERQLLEVKKNEEYAALQHEIQRASARVDEAETQILTLLDAEDAATRTIPVAEAALAQARAAAAEESAVLRQELEVVEADIAARAAERAAIAATVRPDLRTRYEHVLRARPDGAIAGVRGDVCLACRAPVPPQSLTRVKRLDEAVECDGCGRLLALEDALAAAAHASAG